MADLTHEDVQKILQIIDEMGDRDVHLEIGELKVHVTRSAGARSAPSISSPPAAIARPAGASAPRTSPLPASTVPDGHVAVRAPTMGTFYRAGSPGAKPYVETGDRVHADDTVCVFEVMKLFSSLKAGAAGVVAAILVANEALVDQDQPLILIKPD